MMNGVEHSFQSESMKKQRIDINHSLVINNDYQKLLQKEILQDDITSIISEIQPKHVNN